MACRFSAVAIPDLQVGKSAAGRVGDAQAQKVITGFGVVLQHRGHGDFGRGCRIGHRRSKNKHVVPVVAVATGCIAAAHASGQAEIPTPGGKVTRSCLVKIADLPMGDSRLGEILADPTIPAGIKVACIGRTRARSSHQVDRIARRRKRRSIATVDDQIVSTEKGALGCQHGCGQEQADDRQAGQGTGGHSEIPLGCLTYQLVRRSDGVKS